MEQAIFYDCKIPYTGTLSVQSLKRVGLEALHALHKCSSLFFRVFKTSSGPLYMFFSSPLSSSSAFATRHG